MKTRLRLLCSSIFVSICSVLCLGWQGYAFVDDAIGAVNDPYQGSCTYSGNTNGVNGHHVYRMAEKAPVELTMALGETTILHGNNPMLNQVHGSSSPEGFLGFSYGQVIYDSRQDGLSLIMNVGLGTDISAKELGAKASLGFQW